jgi:branched-chain amino acid transport system substrate-binding protein
MLSRMLGRSSARVRARALTLFAATAAVTGVAGCAAATSGTAVTATGPTLTIYSAVPATAASDPVVRDVADAEQLAFTQKANEVTAYKLSFQRVAGSKLSDNARAAIANKSAIAYIGEIVPGASADTLGITNAQDLLQVSPTDTAVELTQPNPAVPGSPSRYYESLKTYGRTFARVVPSTALEAKAQVHQMQSLGVKRLFLADDGSHYGKAIEALVRADAPASGITIAASQSGADGIFYAGANQAAAARAFTSATGSNASLKLFGPSALAGSTLTSQLSTGKPNLYVSVPGFLPKTLPSAAQSFVSAFRAAYGRAPLPQAIFGYEAVASVIDVLKEAGGSANNRSTVVHDYFAIKNRSSVLGTYSINVNGDTNLGPFVFERLQSGALAPFKFVQEQG